MGWISADGFVLFGIDVSFLVAVEFLVCLVFFSKKLPSSFCSVMDIHR